MCIKLQRLLNQKLRARSAKELADCRRQLREHVEKCEVCQKQLKK